ADGVTLDGTNLTLTGNGGSGNDHLIASGQFLDLFNNAVATVLLNGDSGDDVIRTDTTGIVEFGSTLNYRANGGDGRDFVIGVHRFEAGSNGTINAAVIGGRGRDHLALWLIQESGFDTPTINGLMDGGDLARNHQSRDREDMIATDNVFVTNFGPGSRGQRYTIVPGI
ncbi:MAG TPA: hypothetical protein PKD86_12635, partial [Gemmatales bacterium]|nr:hypothetical protein [Gemmatales bacterium]